VSPALILGTAISSILASKLRSILTLLGVVIGVTSVIALMSIGRGAQASITSRIASQGAEVLTVSTDFTATDAEPLTFSDALAIQTSPQAVDVAAVAPTISTGNQPMSVGAVALNASVNGVTPEYFEALAYTLAEGRNLSPADLRSQSNVVILGANLAESLFEGSEPLYQTFSIDGKRFLVVGVLETVGSVGFNRPDDQAFVPLTTAEARLAPNPAPGATIDVSSIIVRAANSKVVDSVARQVDVALRLQHGVSLSGDSDYTISNDVGIAETLEQTTDVLVIFLGVIGGISLVVGGIGIMNIMLVSVTERTREIGIRRAIGARRSAVLLQFLAEATVLSVGGGFIGLGIGYIVTKQFSGVQLLNNTFDAQMSMDVAILAMAVAACIGLVAGIYPAARAASLDPIEALRHE
jgi:putative ABC transport system permease protein